MNKDRHYQAQLREPPQRAKEWTRAHAVPRERKGLVLARQLQLGAGGSVQAVGVGAHAREREPRRQRRLELVERLGAAQAQHRAVVQLADKGEARRVVDGAARVLGGARKARERHLARAPARQGGAREARHV